MERATSIKSISIKNLEFKLRGEELHFLNIHVGGGLFIEDFKSVGYKIVPIATNVVDCVFCFIEIDKHMICFHKFRQNSAADIKSKLSYLFKKYNLTEKDLKKITIFGGSSNNIYPVFSTDELIKIDKYGHKKSSVSELSKRIRSKLQNQKMKYYKYEPGMILMSSGIENTNIPMIDISSDDEGHEQVFMFSSETLKNDESRAIGTLNCNILMDAVIHAFVCNSPNPDKFEAESVTRKNILEKMKTTELITVIYTEPSKNIYFDVFKDEIFYVNLPKNFSFKYNICLKHDQNVSSTVFENFTEDDSLFNTDFSNPVSIVEVESIHSPEFYKKIVKKITRTKSLDPKNTLKQQKFLIK